MSPVIAVVSGMALTFSSVMDVTFALPEFEPDEEIFKNSEFKLEFVIADWCLVPRDGLARANDAADHQGQQEAAADVAAMRRSMSLDPSVDRSKC